MSVIAEQRKHAFVDMQEPAQASAGLFKRFEMHKTIGSRSFWHGYEVFDRKRQRKGILHVISSSAPDFDHRMQVARKWERLNLPGIALVHEVAPFDGGFYVLAEKVDGMPLSTWVTNASPQLEAVLSVFRELARTLSSCHQAQLVWGLLDPRHIHLDGLGHPRIASVPASLVSDLALPDEERSLSVEVLQRAFSSRGRPGSPYCAPELEAQTGMDARADQYGWAASLWETFVGAPPFSATPSFDAKIEIELRRPPQIPVPLMRILERALSPVARDRWPSMQALLKELDRPRSKRTAPWLAAGFCTTLVAVGGAFMSYTGQAHGEDGSGLPADEAPAAAPAPAGAEPEAAAAPTPPATPAEKLQAALGGLGGEEKAQAVTAIAELTAAMVSEEKTEELTKLVEEQVAAADAAQQPAMWREVGSALAKAGAPEAALRSYEKAWSAMDAAGEASGAELLPLREAVLALEGVPELDRITLAADLARKAELDPSELAPALVALAEALSAAEQPANALATYREVLQLTHDVPEVGGENYATWALEASKTARGLKQGAVAKGVLVRALEREHANIDEARLRFALADILWNTKKENQAIDLAEQALKLVGKDPEHDAFRAEVQQWLDD